MVEWKTEHQRRAFKMAGEVVQNLFLVSRLKANWKRENVKVKVSEVFRYFERQVISSQTNVFDVVVTDGEFKRT